MVEVEERVFFCNRAYASLLGFRDPEQIIDRHISGLVAEVDRPRLLDFSRMRTNGVKAPSEYPFLARANDGATVLMQAHVSSSYQNGTCYITTLVQPAIKHASEAPLAALSPRERMVFDLLIRGRRAKEIGLLLHISEKTVATLRGRFMRKLGLNDTWELFQFASNVQLADPSRLEAVSRTGLLDTPPQECFDRVTRLAARGTKAPVAFLSVLDRDRDFYKSSFGLKPDLREIKGETFCHHALLADGPLVINNTRADEIYMRVPTVQALGIAAYLGVPLRLNDLVIGALCVVDFEPREWDADDIDSMHDLAAIAEHEIESRAAASV